MDEKLSDQLALAGLIMDYQKVMLKTPKDKRSVGWFKTQLDGLEKYWDELVQGHKKVARFEEQNKSESYFADDVFSSAATQYNLTKTLLLNAINPGRNQSSIDADSSYADVSLVAPNYKAPLPPIKLPEFSGKQLEWETFKGMFIALVHDIPTIPTILKLQYLIRSLSGEAANRLKNLQITADNYQGAWQALVDKYDNQKVLLASHMANIISCSSMSKRSIEELNRVLEAIRESKQALDNLKIAPEKMGELWLTHHTVHKLDATTRMEWEREADQSDDYPTYKELIGFLERSVRVMEAARPPPTIGSSSPSTNRSFHGSAPSKTKPISAHSAGTQSNKNFTARSCSLCRGNHTLYACQKFQGMEPHKRLEFCKKATLCLNCLQNSHFSRNCPSSKRCLVCQGKHHTKLHSECAGSYSSSPQPDNTACDNPSTSTKSELGDATSAHFSSQIMLNSVSAKKSVLLSTAKVILADHNGFEISVRALIDPGAETSFVSERALAQLSPGIKKVSLSITGVGGKVSSIARKETSFVLKSSLDKSFKINLPALVLSELTQLLPKSEIRKRDWPHIKGLNLADPAFFKPNRVDCILGADIYPLIVLDGVIKGPFGTPMAQETVFGWILTGPTPKECTCHHSSIKVFHTLAEPSLNSQLEKFWEIEEVPQTKPLTPEEQFCEDYFLRSTIRSSDGRFVVRLPFSKKPIFVGSRDIAVAIQIQSEKRLTKNPLLAELYRDFMKEYLDLGHMEIVPREQISRGSYYLPHHAVFRQERPDKIRVVFNASKQAANHLSLNDTLLPGPKLQKDISIVLTRWRFLKIVFVTDIIKMFRQIRVHEEDVDWQRIVWRPTTSQAVLDYRALTVTYGTAPAPFLSLRVLQQLADDGQDSLPEASAMLRHQVYVDDIFGGADNVGVAIQRRNQLIQLLASAGMHLGKWAANEMTLLQDITSDNSDEVPVKMDEVISTLGLKWRPQSDEFTFIYTSSPASTAITKRIILSDVAKLFDPLGWLAPVLVTAKIILQDLWLNKYDWDAPIQGDITIRWMSFRTALMNLSSIRIPRWIGSLEKGNWQLHGFADASKRAYAAAVYAVIPGQSASLLMAKTKIAPVKVETLPRLELSGAVLLTRVTKHLLSEFQQAPDKIHFWTDSKIVLDWLKSHPSRWPTFVANRVSEIGTSFPQAQWRHVQSAFNPADCATRGLTPLQLAETRLWWDGPAWLTSLSESLEESATSDTEQGDSQALVALQFNRVKTAKTDDCLASLQKFSSFSKIQRILAYCGRWKFNAHVTPESRQFGYLTVRELDWAKSACFRAIQQRHYGAELECLRTQKPMPKRNNLTRLAPFLDKLDLIRVGGRLENAPLSYNERHPIVVPSNNLIIRRLVEEIHITTLHGGVRLMQSELARSLWIPRAHQLVTSVYRRCVKCIRFNAKTEQQQMASLPVERLTPQRPFAIAGLDYAGPLPVLFSRGRGAKSTKGYVAIFVCFVVKAIHIEVVSNLTTDAFLAAYARFTARRGVCKTLYSDNATTFKGASNELGLMFSQSSDFYKQAAGQLATRSTDWIFIPPRAPHFGGLWEAAVKSFKYHFKRVVGDSTLTFEELSTLSAKIEACLNSRPLSPLRSGPDDFEALTPGHFLVGSSYLSVPEPLDEPFRGNLCNRWRLLSQLRNSFWIRWKKEVLNQLQQRNKWQNPQNNLQIGDVVIIKDELSPPAKWSLGLVTETHPGKDGLVRVVTVKTPSSTLTRPIVKLVKLPTAMDAEEAFHQFTNTANQR